eukprot:6067248-Amphidinium_carterae.1
MEPHVGAQRERLAGGQGISCSRLYVTLCFMPSLCPELVLRCVVWVISQSDFKIVQLQSGRLCILQAPLVDSASYHGSAVGMQHSSIF